VALRVWSLVAAAEFNYLRGGRRWCSMWSLVAPLTRCFHHCGLQELAPWLLGQASWGFPFCLIADPTG
jgi:hypothetical protein